MSEDGMHVHGPHDHAVEHVAEHGGSDSFAGRIAVMTAILATVGAMMSYEAGATQAEAMMQKNEAAIKKTEASDQWNYYQAKGQKANLSVLGAALAPDEAKAAKFKQESTRYEGEKAEIKKEAEALEAKSKQADDASELSMHHHHRWAQATTLIQVAIALSAMALLTRKKWLSWGAYAISLASLAVGAMALMGL